MSDNELYKERSYAGCIGAAFEMLCANFATIFRRTWVPALVAALVGALSVLVPLPVVVAASDVAPFFLAVGAQIAVLILFLAAFAWMNAGVVTLLNAEQRRVNMLRCFRSTALFFGTSAVLFLLIVGSGFVLILSRYGEMPATQWTILGAFALVFLVLAVVMFVVYVPTVYSNMRYLVAGDCSLWSVFGKNYAVGWSHWGFLALVTFLIALIVLVVSVVAGVPQVTLVLAEQVDNFGVMVLGDASDLPDNFLFLRYVVNFLTSFVLLYLCVWCELVCYFAYGRTEHRVRRKADEAARKAAASPSGDRFLV